MTISSVNSDKSLTSNDGYEKGQQDTKKDQIYKKAKLYTKQYNIRVNVGK